MAWQNNKIIVFGGLRGNIAKKLGYNLEVRWSKFEDMAFFINKSEYGIQPDTLIPIWLRTNNKFSIIHDNGSLFTVKGELSLAADAYLNVWFGGEYNTYSLDNLSQPYHKPLSSVKLGASYLFVKKLKVWTEMYYYGKRYAVLQSGLIVDVELDGFLDLNLGADYAISDKFSVFLSATNLLNKHYERYYSYPVQGINVMAGVSLKF
jgi:outer membrane receptor protein involved in Fe transport